MSDYSVKVIINGPNNEHTATYKTCVLRANTSFADQVTEPNTKYVVKWDFNLNGETVTVPENCIIEFDGGTLKNGIIIGQNTFINNVGGLDDSIIFGEGITKQGTWRQNEGGGSIEQIQSDWEQIDDSKPDFIKNKPAIPAAQIQSDWNQTDTSNKDFIKNKPTIPVVPTKVSSFENDANYVNTSQLGAKQDRLISGNNIKTINNQSILGNGNIQIEGGSTITVDAAISTTSTNPVQNKVIAEALENASSATDKEYDPTAYSGLGVKYLKLVGGSNILRQSDFDKSNTIYVISNDFDLDGASITIPAGCILDFDGGSISNGTLIGTDTQIRADNKAIFTDIIIDGTWNVPYITTEWFSDAQDVNDVLNNKNKLGRVFKLCSDNVQNFVHIKEGIYYVSVFNNNDSAIDLTSNTVVDIAGTIQLLRNSFPRYKIFDISEKSNIIIEGSGKIIGDELVHDYETTALSLGTKVVSTNASNTPNIASLYTDNGSIKGTLEPSQSIVGNCYWVRTSSFGSNIRYNYYVVKASTSTPVTYSFDRTNTHEWGKGISCIYGAHDIIIRGVSISFCTGDGIYVGNSSEQGDERTKPQNYQIQLDGVSIDSCRRQGISVTDVWHFELKNSVIKNIVGTSPQAAIDVEPNDYHECRYILIENNKMTDNVRGIYLTVGSDSYQREIEHISNVVIRNNTIYSTFGGIYSHYYEDVLTIENNIIVCNNRAVSIGGSDTPSQVNLCNNVITTTLSSNDIRESADYSAIFLWGSHDSIISCNTITTDVEEVLFARNCKVVGNKIKSNSSLIKTMGSDNFTNIFEGNTIDVNNIISNNAGVESNLHFNKNTINVKTSFAVQLIGINSFCNNRFINEGDDALVIEFVDANIFTRFDFNGNYIRNLAVKLRPRNYTVVSNNTFRYSGSFSSNSEVVLIVANDIFDNNEILISGTANISSLNYVISSGSNSNAVIKGNKFTLNNVVCPELYHSSTTTTSFIDNFISGAKNITTLINLSGAMGFRDGTYLKLGATGYRPTLPNQKVYNGFMFYDTTLKKPIWWNGTAWTDATGATV